MKIFRYLRAALATLLGLLLVTGAGAQMLSLPRDCKYKTGDDSNWANPGFDDHDWEPQQLGKSWAAKGIKENVYAWYRIRFVIPSSMKALAQKGNGLKIHLGKIDDVDETFFNGRLIGKTGGFPPRYQTQWDAERTYIIPETEVRWDAENLVAVRLFSPDPGGVGMYQGAYDFGPLQWSDHISVTHHFIRAAPHTVNARIQLHNHKGAAFSGTVACWVLDSLHQKRYAASEPVQIKAVKGIEKTISFKFAAPAGHPAFRVGYSITETRTGIGISNEELYLFNPNLRIQVQAPPRPVVENAVAGTFTSLPFQRQQQRGYLGARMNRNLVERLLKVDEPGLLDGYLQRPGHHPWAGEHIGKYLETACNVWKSTGDKKLKIQMDRLMYQLIHAQLPDGYLGTYTPDVYWTGWDVWSHKYNLYGLLAYYKTTGYRPALEVCKKMGDLICASFGNGQRDIIGAGEHIGMAATSVLDPMVELYRYTGEKKYLDFCNYIIKAWEQANGPRIISALLATGRVNEVANGKAYEMLSNLLGLASLYRLTGNDSLLRPVLLAWEDIVARRLYITGTASTHELFKEDEYLPASAKDNMGEGCVTTTWMQLNQCLLDITGNMKYAAQIETSIYNHLLAAENPQTGCVSYYTPLMDKKPFTCHITCCQSSVPRGIALIPAFTFGMVAQTPTLMVYEPAVYQTELQTGNKMAIGLRMEVESGFPETGGALIKIFPSKPAVFAIALRVPAWCTAFTATVNNQVYETDAVAQHCVISRAWKPGDQVRVTFEMPLQVLPGGSSYPGMAALQRGPQVLALDDTLNAGFLRHPEWPAAALLSGKTNLLSTAAPLLPAGWMGKQAYNLMLPGNEKKHARRLPLLTPFADAGQTDGTLRVWLPLK